MNKITTRASFYFQNDTTYFGAIVGRVANRIKGAQFTLNGQKYKLVANDGNNTLHGMTSLLFSICQTGEISSC